MKKFTLALCLLTSAALFGGAKATPAESAMPANQGMGMGAPQSQSLTISEVIDNGNKLVLSDGSTYQIDPNDSNKVAGWLGAADVTVTPGTNPNYPYSITNTWTGTTVNGQKMESSYNPNMSQQPSMSNQQQMNQPGQPMQQQPMQQPMQQQRKPMNQGY